MMNTQIIAVSRSQRSILFRIAFFKSALNNGKNEENAKPKFTRLLKPEGEDVVWARIDDIGQSMMSCQ